MKKWPLLLMAVGFVCMQSCKEIGPTIAGPGDGAAAGEDTAYMADVEAPQAKKVFAEEFTGVSCPPCPNGHQEMASIKSQLNGNLVIVGYHIFNYPQADPVKKDGQLLSKYDFRTEAATEVGNVIFGGVGQLPVAAFDRLDNSGEKLINRPWSNTGISAANNPSSVNIHITNSYNDSSKEATIIVKLAYTSDVDIKQNLTLLVVEDSIIDAQKTLNPPPNEIIKEYVHEHVVRDFITPTYGTPIPEKANPKVAGKVYERTFKYTLDEAWHPEHCYIVAVVNNDAAGNRTVMQAEEVKLIK